MVPTELLELGVLGPWILGQLFINKRGVPFYQGWQNTPCKYLL